MISLPVVDKITIRNYSLYPGENNSGIVIDFSQGVTVLAGINGVGKTTLLNLLLRMILGPSSPKMSQDISRVSKRDLVLSKSKKFDFFSKRVPDGGKNATATIEFSIAGKRIVIVRFLYSMRVKSFTINNRKVSGADDEIAIIEKLAQLAGLESGYDFHMVVRYLQFFTEERLPILWSPGTQFEFFKMLFFDTSLSSQLSETFKQIQRVDTDYRNRRNQQTIRQKRLDSENPPESDIEIATLEKMLKHAEESYQDLNSSFAHDHENLNNAQKIVIELESQLSNCEVNLSKLEDQCSHDDALYIAQSLPGLDDKLNFLMQGLGSRVGCFVCGKKGKKEFNEINKTLRKGNCFVCNSSLTDVNKGKVTPIGVKKIREQNTQIDALIKEIEILKDKIIEAQNRRDMLQKSVNEKSHSRLTAYHEIQKLRSQIPNKKVSDISPLKSEIEREEAELNNLDIERKGLTDQYRRLVGEAQERMDDAKESIRNRMSYYAEEFLQETVDITFDRKTPFKLATGAGKVNIPTFSVGMTSSTFKVAQKRLTPDSVSESQKEFLDLAFRMTLLDLVCEGANQMMVIETPEASLDSWFMRRAATLMRTFAPTDPEKNRKLIATSNLNGTVMIPALLGIIDGNGHINKKLKKDDVHLVNLMDLTAKAKVLEKDDAKEMLFRELGEYINA